jgi:hypothetical protein
MCAYDAKEDKFTWPGAKGKPPGGDGNGGDVFAYDPVHDIVIMPRGKSTWIFRPAENLWEERKTPEAPGAPGHYGSLTFDVEARRAVYPVAVGTGKSSKEPPPAAEADRWRLNRKDKSWQELLQEIYTYDPEANKWEKLPVKPDAPRPCWRYRCGLTYDSKNKVVIMIGGSTNTWESDEKYYNDVWVLETAKAVWTRMDPPKPWPTGGNAWRDNRSCAYDEADNAVLWMPNDGAVWAYRYR